jgi:hypothetical protein
MARCVPWVHFRPNQRPSPWRHVRVSVRGKGDGCDPYLCGNLPWTLLCSDSAKNWIDPSRTERMRRQCVRTAPPSNVVAPVGRARQGLDRRLLRLDGASQAHHGINNSRKNKNVGVELLPPPNGPRYRPIPTPGDGPHHPFGVPALVDAGWAKSAAAAKSGRFSHVPIVIKERWDPVRSRGGRRNPLVPSREKPTSFRTLQSPSGGASSLPSGRVPGRLPRPRRPRHQEFAFEPLLAGRGPRGNAGDPKRLGFGDTAHRLLQLWKWLTRWIRARSALGFVSMLEKGFKRTGKEAGDSYRGRWHAAAIFWSSRRPTDFCARGSGRSITPKPPSNGDALILCQDPCCNVSNGKV